MSEPCQADISQLGYNLIMKNKLIIQTNIEPLDCTLKDYKNARIIKFSIQSSNDIQYLEVQLEKACKMFEFDCIEIFLIKGNKLNTKLVNAIEDSLQRFSPKSSLHIVNIG